jgi:hypothetical protein
MTKNRTGNPWQLKAFRLPQLCFLAEALFFPGFDFFPGSAFLAFAATLVTVLAP